MQQDDAFFHNNCIPVIVLIQLNLGSLENTKMCVFILVYQILLQKKGLSKEHLFRIEVRTSFLLTELYRTCNFETLEMKHNKFLGNTTSQSSSPPGSKLLSMKIVEVFPSLSRLHT